VNLKRVFLLSLLLGLAVRSTSAQPTCTSLINPIGEYAACEGIYRLSEYVFVGQVVHLEQVPSPMKGWGGSWYKATVTVEKLIKGHLDPQVELTLDGRCYGHAYESRKYLFTAEWSNSDEVNGLIAHKWSNDLTDVPPDDLTRRLNEIDDILQGVPQPRLIGRVMEYGWGGQFLIPIQPVSGIDIVIEDTQGVQVVAQTDDEGRYQVDQLPPGRYSVHPVMTKEGDIRRGGELLKRGSAEIEVGTQVCSQILTFDLEPVGGIVGTIERRNGDWQNDARLSLQRAERKTQGFEVTPATRTLSDTSLSVGREGNVIRFAFDRVPPGQYILRISALDPQGQPEDIFYPFERDSKKAELIKVELNKTTKLAVTFPSLPERRIFGRVVRLDGSSVDAKVRLITGASGSYQVPADSPILSDDLDGKIEQRTRNGQFEFRNWGGREVRLFAFYDGIKDGKPVRFFGRSQNLRLEHDFGPLTITLDRFEPW
jgi:hypothetical protein